MAATPSLPFRIIKRSLLDTRWAARPSLRPLTTISHSLSTEPIPEPLLRSRAHPIPERDLPTTPKIPSTSSSPRRKRRGPTPPPLPSSNAPRSAPPQPETLHQDAHVDPSIAQLLPLLKSQPPHYTRVHIHAKPYLVTAGDVLRLPFLMHGVLPGDILRLNRATLLGSRDYTLKAGAGGCEGSTVGWIDERLFTCRARVLGVELEPLRLKEKTKRRQRHIRRVGSKHQYTVLRVMEVSVNDIDALPKAASEEVGATSVGGVGELEDPATGDALVVGSAEAKNAAKTETKRRTKTNGSGKVGLKEVIEEDREGEIEQLVEETGKVSV